MGPFFAYICKFNLSMTIVDMVEKSPDALLRSTNCSDNSSYDHLADVGVYGSYTEEHTLALLSSKSLHNWRLEKAILERNIERCKRKRYLAKFKQPAEYIASLNRRVILFNIEQQQQESPLLQNEAQQDRAQEEQLQPIISNLLPWSKGEKDFLLSAYFIGYVIVQVPIARLAEVLGAKPVFVAAGLGTSFCTLLFPLASYLSVYAASLMRIVLGFFQAGIFPACYVLLCEWLPKEELSRYLTWPSAFSRVGTIVMNLLIPMIIFNLNWEWVFYISGGTTLAWTIFFMVFGSNSPNQSHWISKGELIYVESRMEPRVGTQSGSGGADFSITQMPLAKPAISWKKIATNRALLLMSLVMFTSEWSNMLLLIKLPGFLGSALKMDLGEISIWSSVLIVVYCVVFPMSGFVASKLEASNIEALNALRIRKIFEASALTFQAIGSVMIALSCDRAIIAVALLTIMFGRSLVGGGQCLMPPELSKEYPGTVFAYANSLANLAGFFGPNIMTAMVDNPEDHGSWTSIWLLSAMIFLTGGLLFCLFAENDPQNYSKRPKTRVIATDKSLTLDPPEVFQMDAFSRVTCEPNPQVDLKTPGPSAPSSSSRGARKRVTRKI